MADDESIKSCVHKRFVELAADAAAHVPAPKAKPKPPTKAQLEFWPEDRRSAPNALLRSALFCAGKPPTKREFFREYQLAPSLAPYQVKYTGPRLYQPDLDVWLELVHRCRLLALGTTVEFPIRPMLKALGRPIGKSGRDWLTSTFTLLRATAVHVRWVDPQTNSRRGYIGGLVDSLLYDEAMCRWRITLDPKIVELFAPDQHTWMSVETRMKFGKSYLAKWLHGYFSSHRKPQPLSVKRLRELSGSSISELWKFRQNLKVAMEEVAFVEQSNRLRFKWHIDTDDLVHVMRESGH